MTTMKEALIVALRQPSPPWHLRDALSVLQVERISLRSLIAGIDQQRFTLWVAVIEPSDVLTFLQEPRTVQELAGFINNPPVPSRATLVRLFEKLNPVGVSLVLSKKNSHVVGITGTAQSLARIDALALQDLLAPKIANQGLIKPQETAVGPGDANIINGIAIEGGLILTLAVAAASITAPVSFPVCIAIGVGVGVTASAGELLIEMGIKQNQQSNQPTEPTRPTSSNGEDGNDPIGDVLEFSDAQFGDPPSDIKDALAGGEDIGKFEIPDPNAIPDFPPIEPDEGGNVVV